jgi:ribosomal protein S18 acetylase RimI-like enzyme
MTGRSIMLKKEQTQSIFLKIRKADTDDLGRIEKLYKDCRVKLMDCGLYQWDERYPSVGTFTESIGNQCQYLFEEGNLLVGSVILNEAQSTEWNAIHWHYQEDKVLIVHALAISPDSQGMGYGRQALKLCEAHGADNGYAAIRLDVFSENQAAIGLYEKNGFEKAGEVTFDFKPEGHQKYYCYEKRLTVR